MCATTTNQSAEPQVTESQLLSALKTASPDAKRSAYRLLLMNQEPLEPSPRIWVPGEPATWGMGAGNRKRKPEHLKDWQQAVGWAWRQYSGPLQLSGPVQLDFLFKTAKNRKDTSNMVKAAEDALKNVAFGDDDRVYRIVAVKEPVSVGSGGMYFRIARYGGPAFKEHL